MEQEIWKPVVGYEGLYEVSSLGRVKSLERLVKNDKKDGFTLIKEKVLSLCSSGRQYYYVSLTKDSSSKKVKDISKQERTMVDFFKSVYKKKKPL